MAVPELEPPDPDILLQRLRYAVHEWKRTGGEVPGSTELVILRWQALDHYLSDGGTLPWHWRDARRGGRGTVDVLLPEPPEGSEPLL
jgi:hypothetical protein